MVLHHFSKVGGINCARMSARLDIPKDTDSDLFFSLEELRVLYFKKSPLMASSSEG